MVRRPHVAHLDVARLAVLAVCLLMPSAVLALDLHILPTRASGVEGIDWFLGPGEREITLLQTGQSVEVEVFASNFTPHVIAVYQARLDCNSFDFSEAGELVPISHNCNEEGGWGTAFCLGVDLDHPAFLFAGIEPVLAACNNLGMCGDMEPGFYACGALPIVDEGASDEGTLYYLMTFAYDVSVDARGQAAPGLDPDPLETFVIDQLTAHLPINVIGTPVISVPSGACCGQQIGPLNCMDSTTQQECASAGGAWFADQLCAGVDRAPVDGTDDFCPLCARHEDCDDGDACTDDSCDGHVCVSEDNTPENLCCNPNDGVVTPIDDGNACTDDACLSDGTVEHVLIDGCAPCNDAGDCDDADLCTADSCPLGICVFDDFTPPDFCCDPTDGSTEPIDDGDPCTTDDCGPEGVMHVPVEGCCSVNAECDDGSACTADACVMAECVNTDTVPEGSCCDPKTGVITVISDEDPCTVDTCNADGTVDHTPVRNCEADLIVRFTRASGVEGVDWALGPEPGAITLEHGGQMVELEVYIAGFGPETIATYQATLDCESLEFSLEGSAAAIDDQCPSGQFGGSFCLGVDESRPDYLFADVNATLPACQNVTLCPDGTPGHYACGSVALGDEYGEDEGLDYYAMTFALNVPSNALGSVHLGLHHDPDSTLLYDPLGLPLPLAIEPAILTVSYGMCCGVSTEPLWCGDAYSSEACAALGGGFTEGEFCSDVDFNGDGVDDACPNCSSDADCDDANACTVDSCSSRGCISEELTRQGQCCNPASGELTPIDDGNDCTDDACLSDGSVSHLPSVAGTPCSDSEHCTAEDQCNGAGECEGVDINSIACNTIFDCPAGATECRETACVCADPCPDSSVGGIVEINGCETGVANLYVEYDCTMQDLVNNCDDRRFLVTPTDRVRRCVRQLAHEWLAGGIINAQQARSLLRCATPKRPS